MNRNQSILIWFQKRRIKWRKCMGKNGGNTNANNSTENFIFNHYSLILIFKFIFNLRL